MKIEEFQKLKDLAESELKITEDNVMDKSIQLSNLYSRFLNIYIKELRILKEISVDKDKIYGELYDKYKFHFDYQLDGKSEIDTYVRKDDKFYQIALTYSQQEVQVQFLEQTLNHINNLGFRIKNFVDLKKIKMGLL